MSKMSEHDLLIREAKKIVKGLAKTLSPMCEVVLHDLRTPDHSIVMIENNFSGRQTGGSATELGLARIADSNFPDIIANYANQLSDGRTLKSTSMGLKDSKGNFVAAICLNIDISYMQSITAYLEDFSRIDSDTPKENLNASTKSIEARVQAFASQHNKPPSALSPQEKREVVQLLSNEGYMQQRGAANKISALLGSSRSSIYYYLR